ncbi:hypothetical protein GTQ34_04740 [Muricauda sp. JGD-17]|uniref:Sulfotransferase family protein n=1 Tax=Flagellimonas ochracea TaxID=2696472 RepID=A0A964TAF3_9FLAO|nr:hypothetical protein [Allomuricauda ochracea]NAY91219.1 hypothetical protein [Allomuricauda ochracea]
MIREINKFIVRTPLHKTAIELKAKKIWKGFSKENSKILDNRTIYSISPYKTGTTFLAGCFDYSISKHEPIHYASVKKMEEDFDGFFIRRLNSLNLKLESSGFWSAYVDQLANHHIGKDLTYICILRKPSSWVTSVVNHWYQIKRYRQNYFWTNELFWKKIVGVDLSNFYEYSEEQQNDIISKMLDFYMSFTKKTGNLKHVHYVWIHDMTNFLPTLEQLMDEKSKPESSKQNKGLVKHFVYENKEIDNEYASLVESLSNK